MPKFSEKEKKCIEEKLLQEGEQLFTLYGLKTTIDQLAEKSGIAKASFYKFYESKEALYFDILRRSQKEIFLKLEKQLENSKALSPHQRVKEVFASMYQWMLQYPLLAKTDLPTAETIARKVSSCQLAGLSEQQRMAVHSLKEHGIVFTQDERVVCLVFEGLYRAWLAMDQADPQPQQQTIDLLLDGALDQLIEETNSSLSKKDVSN